MKTKTLISLLTLACLLAVPATAQVNYAVSGGSAYVTSSPNASGNIVIASTYQGKPVTSIGYSAFYNCTSLTNVTIPNSVTSIGDQAFFYCTNLTNVTIPNSVTSIGIQAFYSCTSLTNVMIGNGVTNIGSQAFYECTSLTNISVDAANLVYSSLDGVVFNKSQTTLFHFPFGRGGNYVIPNSVTSIGEFAFYACHTLTSVTIQNGVTSIGIEAFSFCNSLTNVTIPNSVISIGRYAFGYCTSLTNVMIGNSVTSIGNGAFSSCTSLTSVTIPNSVTNIGNTAFSFSTSLTNISVDASNMFYSSLEGVVFNKAQTTLFQFPVGRGGAYAIPGSVTSIGEAAFYYCPRLASVTIPNSVTSLGNQAFSYCISLTSVTIGNSVTNIGSEAFAGCTSLTSVTIPNSVTSIGSDAFYDCTSLTGVYFQGNALSVGSSVFLDAYNVTVYYLPGTTGWGTTFGGRPAVLWNPLMQTGDASFGVRTNRFGFTITGASNLVLVVEAATNLANPAWTPVGTNTLTGGSSYFSDPGPRNHPARFYRLRSP
jgi:hypothetical protein